MSNNRQEMGHSPRFDALLADYIQAREDERSFSVSQATLYTIALAVLSFLVAILTQLCGGPETLDTSCPPDGVLAGLPLLPSALLSLALVSGRQSIIRSFYLRLLEREIRTSITTAGESGNFSTESAVLVAPEATQDSDPLPILAATELQVVEATLSRGRRVSRLLLALSGFVIVSSFLAITFAIALKVSLPWVLAMILVYGIWAFVGIRAFVESTLSGRELYHSTANEARLRIGRDKLDPGSDSRRKTENRGLLRYVLWPRPDDVVKYIHFPAGVLASLLSGRTSAESLTGVSLWSAVAYWLALEYFAYYARYQWNDVVGVHSDHDHPQRRSKQRLPIGDGSPTSIKRSVVVSLATAAVRMYLLVLLLTISSLSLWPGLAFSALLVFLVALPYERLRSIKPKTVTGKQATSWAIFWLVGAGYAIRGGSGYISLSLVQPPFSQQRGASAPATGFVSGFQRFLAVITEPDVLWFVAFMWVFGSAFVLLVWTLEASSYAKQPVIPPRAFRLLGASAQIDCHSAIARVPHLVVLLEGLGMHVRLLDAAQSSDLATIDGFAAGLRSKPLMPGDRRLGPHVLFSVAAGAIAGWLAAPLDGLSDAAAVRVVVTFAVVTLLIGVIPPAVRFSAVVLVSVALASGIGFRLLGVEVAPVAGVAMVLVCLVILFFRSQSYYTLRHGLNWLAPTAIAASLYGCRKLLGDTVADLWQLPTRHGLQASWTWKGLMDESLGVVECSQGHRVRIRVHGDSAWIGDEEVAMHELEALYCKVFSNDVSSLRASRWLADFRCAADSGAIWMPRRVARTLSQLEFEDLD
jgi:hypothetical protein